MDQKADSKTPLDNTIFFLILITTLFIQSLFILASITRRGIMKQEVLLQKTNLGFDIAIYHE